MARKASFIAFPHSSSAQTNGCKTGAGRGRTDTDSLLHLICMRPSFVQDTHGQISGAAERLILRKTGLSLCTSTELRKFVCTWLRESCRQVAAEVISNSWSKLMKPCTKKFSHLCTPSANQLHIHPHSKALLEQNLNPDSVGINTFIFLYQCSVAILLFEISEFVTHPGLEA